MIAALVILVVGCSEKPTAVESAPAVHTLNGKLRFDQPTTIPADARVLALWNVDPDSASGYWYLHGEGTVNMADSSYSIRFDALPPEDALNPGGFGVVYVVMTSANTVRSGHLQDDQTDALRVTMLGATEDHGLIYIRTTADSGAVRKPWLGRFSRGFTVGRGIRDNPTDTIYARDEFEPAAAGTMTLTIDDPKKLDRIRW
jgi:hypothetical protein